MGLSRAALGLLAENKRFGRCSAGTRTRTGTGSPRWHPDVASCHPCCTPTFGGHRATLGQKPRAGERAGVAAAPGGLPSRPGGEGSRELCLPIPLPSGMRCSSHPRCQRPAELFLPGAEGNSRWRLSRWRGSPNQAEWTLACAQGCHPQPVGSGGGWRWTRTVLQLCRRFGASLSLWVRFPRGTPRPSALPRLAESGSGLRGG